VGTFRWFTTHTTADSDSVVFSMESCHSKVERRRTVHVVHMKKHSNDDENDATLADERLHRGKDVGPWSHSEKGGGEEPG
jgi:hypothetical protein